MAKHGSEEQYNKNVINAFKHGDDPEIIIVVDKLLTGFDAPRNTVLYLTRQLKDHTLLQAIARVNRLYEGKDFGYIIDYRGVLQNLNKAFDLYGKLEDFDQADLEDAITDVAEEIQKLPQRHSDLWDLFKGIKNKQDEEQYEQLLADQEVREQFYERLSAYCPDPGHRPVLDPVHGGHARRQGREVQGRPDVLREAAGGRQAGGTPRSSTSRSTRPRSRS